MNTFFTQQNIFICFIVGMAVFIANESRARDKRNDKREGRHEKSFEDIEIRHEESFRSRVRIVEEKIDKTNKCNDFLRQEHEHMIDLLKDLKLLIKEEGQKCQKEKHEEIVLKMEEQLKNMQ